MLTIIITTLSLGIIAAGLRQIFVSLESVHKIFSFHLFLSVLLLYTMILIGFAIIYLALVERGIPVYSETFHVGHTDWMHEMARSLYFSGVTLFTVGYGDMVPAGIGRWIALAEAMIGYALPAALVAKVWQAK
ncbi:two pore domain potassium channel family protein [Halobacillus fulvus]|nr:two pore domain potassium channel family protein [Halobacillus fulvus]